MSVLKSAMQEKFCQELAVGCSKKEAAIRAGYSRRSALQHGHLLATKPHVAARVKELQDSKIETTIADVTQRKIILSNIIRSEKSEPGVMISAIRQLNKMEGVYFKKLDEAKCDMKDIKIIYCLDNPRRERFCLEMTTGCSQREAAERAGYNPSSSNDCGYKLMKKPEIRARIKELQDKASPEGHD